MKISQAQEFTQNGRSDIFILTAHGCRAQPEMKIGQLVDFLLNLRYQG